MNAIKYQREKARLTQIDIATSLGIQQSTISMWESGESMPRADKLPELAKLFNCSIDDLFKEGEETE